MLNFDVIIIGAGAAGLMCAGTAIKRGRRVLIIERSKKPAEKIRISGGGRCNFANFFTTPSNYLSNNEKFSISALKRFDQHDFIRLVEKHAIDYEQRNHGQLFCLGPAQQITNMLLSEAQGAKLLTTTSVTDIQKNSDVFTVKTDKGLFTASSLVIATGGPSIPKMGATGFAYKIAEQFGLNIIPPRAGLVPFILDENTLKSMDGLPGVAVDARVSCNKTSFLEALLFTHRGLSGPVILQVSSYWHPGQAITIDLLPNQNAREILLNAKKNNPKKDMHSILSTLFPKRFAAKLCEWTECHGRLAETSDKKVKVLAQHINQWTVTPTGTEGYRTAEVTLGGIDTNELSSKTMEVKSTPGLYFIGEAVDVTGHLGGFNFGWAWSSGHAAGEVV